MSPQGKYQAYNTAAQTMAKTRQIVLLYDGIIRFAQQWRSAMEQQNTEQRFNAFRRINDIVDALHNCLDFEQGGEMADMLAAFYHNLSMDLAQADRTQNLKLVDDVLARVRRMRDSWEEIDKSQPPAADSMPASASNGSGGEGGSSFEYSA
ncbi:MAG: flagellar export chaperone FliS [Alphaproteobacteria bacterium]|nr:flagellar export chaperone FliS [Alphaproteobacteria bacterium]